MSKGKCVFNSSWLLDKYVKPWLAASPDKHYALCKLCKKTFSIASMGISALKSNMAGKTHQERMEKQGNPITAFLKTATSVDIIETSTSYGHSTSSMDVPVGNSLASAGDSQNMDSHQFIILQLCQKRFLMQRYCEH